MYSSTTPLKELTLEIGHQAYLYHKATAYDYFIAYAQLNLLVIDMKATINYLAAGIIRHAILNFNIMCRAVHARGCNIIYFIRTHLALIIFGLFYLYHDVGSSATP